MYPESNSQALQDIFVLSLLTKRQGTYIEIGGFHSRELSNSYLLEKSYEWDGIIVEIDSKAAEEIAQNRKSEVLNADALKINWASVLRRRPELRNADYLQVDCEPAMASLVALLRVLRAGVRPTVITFEHDVYAGHTFARVLHQGRLVRGISRPILRLLGYTLVAPDIATNTGKPFEDWYALTSRISLKIPPSHKGPLVPADFLKTAGLSNSYMDFREQHLI